MLITIIAFAIIITISTIQAYTNGLARKEQNREIEKLKALCEQLDKQLESKEKEIKRQSTMIRYRNSVIYRHEVLIAKLTGDKKILRGRKLKN